jgi:hypothetical protein
MRDRPFSHLRPVGGRPLRGGIQVNSHINLLASFGRSGTSCDPLDIWQILSRWTHDALRKDASPVQWAVTLFIVPLITTAIEWVTWFKQRSARLALAD